MKYIVHRVNDPDRLESLDPSMGVEIDLRDKGGRLIMEHDPFSDGPDFDGYLARYRHDTMILNIKSEAIEWRVLEEIQKAGTVRDYFFLDSSFPMIMKLVAKGERRVAVRFSEREPIEYALALAGKIDWVWVDCFTRLPLDGTSYPQLKKHFKICIVSPELQAHSLDRIPEFAQILAEMPVDAICTKRPELWDAALNGKTQ